MKRRAGAVLIQSVYMALTLWPPLAVICLRGGAPLGLGALLLWLGAALGYAVAAFAKKRKGLYSALAFAAAVALSLLPPLALPWRVGLALVMAIASAAALRTRYGAEYRLLDSKVVSLGLVLYAVLFVVLFFLQWEEPMAALGYGCFADVLLTLLLGNRMAVDEVSGGQARRMMGGNQLLTLALSGVFALLVFIRPIRDGAAALFRSLLAWLLGLIPQGSGDVQQETGGQLMGDLGAMLGVEESARPAWLDQLLHILAMVIATAVLLALAALAIFALWRAARALAARLKTWFQDFGRSGGEDYVEESEQLLSLENMGKQFRQDLGQRLRKLFVRPVPWEKLDGRGRVRRLYGIVLRRLAVYTPGARAMTPQRLLQAAEKDPAFAALYDRARYSEREISLAEAERARVQLKEKV